MSQLGEEVWMVCKAMALGETPLKRTNRIFQLLTRSLGHSDI